MTECLHVIIYLCSKPAGMIGNILEREREREREREIERELQKQVNNENVNT